MKTERMVLLVTPEEKARITAEAAKLGVSASEYIRRLTAMLDAEDMQAIEELAQLGPELDAMVDRLEAVFEDFDAKEKLREERRAYLHSDEYREKIREEVLNDPNINWDAVRALFGGDGEGEEAAA